MVILRSQLGRRVHVLPNEDDLAAAVAVRGAPVRGARAAVGAEHGGEPRGPLRARRGRPRRLPAVPPRQLLP